MNRIRADKIDLIRVLIIELKLKNSRYSLQKDSSGVLENTFPAFLPTGLP